MAGLDEKNKEAAALAQFEREMDMFGFDEETVAELREMVFAKKDYGPVIAILDKNSDAEYDVPLDYTIEDPDVREIKAQYDRDSMVTEANIRDIKEFIETCKDPDLLKEAKYILEIQESLLSVPRY